MIPKTKPIRDPGYLAWLRTLPCALCGHTPCDAAHQRLLGGGVGSKPGDDLAIPLCWKCHDSEHRRGVLTTWNEYLPDGIEWTREDLREHLRGLCKGLRRRYMRGK
jgi:hypothetical protein